MRLRRRRLALASRILAPSLVVALVLAGSTPHATADHHEERYTVVLPRVDVGGGSPAKPQEQVSVGLETACRINDEGHVTCWALWSGEVLEGLPGRYRQVSVGNEGHCGVRLDGQILCSMDAYSGVWEAPPGRYVQVNTSDLTACGLRTDGTIACWLWWGWEEESVPVAHPGPSGTYRQITSAGEVVCGLRSDHTVTCREWEDAGPFWSGPSADIAQIEMDPSTDDTALLLRTDGTVSWWYMEAGRTPAAPPGRFRHVSWQGWPACGLSTEGEIVCWEGENDTIPAPEGIFQSIDAGAGALCGIRMDESLACWEWDEDDELVPVPVP